MAANTVYKLHAIIFPLPYQGHIDPTINLAVKLASKGITVTFVHTEYVHYTLARAHCTDKNPHEVDFFSEARKSGLDIRYKTINDGFPLDYDRTLHFDDLWEFFLEDFPAKVDEFVGHIIRSDPSDLIPFLVADTFFSWSKPIAVKYNLVNVSFWTQPATVLSIGYHLDLLAQNGHLSSKDNITEEEISYLPGIKAISTKHLMLYLNEPEGTAVHKLTTRAFEQIKNADFILSNTVDELESAPLSALNQEQPIYAVGPVNSMRNNLTKSTIAKSLWAESDCTKWLENKSPASVLYISFGSLAQISKEQFQELAYGLLLSQVNFIWVVRDDILNSGFPPGFDDEMGDKGLIIPWCDQTLVLSNPAIGGFLTHCGWNSVCECLLFGVPMICYPCLFDQNTNRKLVVDDWKIGIDLFDGASVCREQVAEKIENFMNGASSQSLRREAEKVKMIVRNALEIDGSSERKFDQFVKDLKNKVCSMNQGLSLS